MYKRFSGMTVCGEGELIKTARQSTEQQLAAHIAAIQPAVDKWEQSLTEDQKKVTVPAGQVLAIALDETTGDQAKIVTANAESPPAGRVVGKPQWKPGKLAGAFEFDGKTLIDCGQAGVLDKGDHFSFAAWINPTL